MKKWIFGMAALAAAMCFGATTEDGVTKERRGALGPNDMVVTDVDATGIVAARTYTKAEVDRRIATNAPVRSVNGKTGRVVLGANDVGALPNNRDGLKASANFRNAVWDVQIKSSGGVDTNAVRDIIRDEITPATNSLNQTLSYALDDKRDLVDRAVYKIGKSAFVLHKDGLTDKTLPFVEKGQGKPYPYNEYDWVYPIGETTAFHAIVFSDGRWKLNIADGAEYGYSPASEDALRIEFDNGYVATRSSIISAVPVDDQQLAAVATGDAQKPANGDLVKYDAANDRFVKATAGTDYVKDISGKMDKVNSASKGFLVADENGNAQPSSLVDEIAIGEMQLSLQNKADRATTLSGYGITDATPLSMISEDDPTFSNAVLAVGLNIDTNSVAVLNDIASTFGGFPLGAGGTVTTVGGLLAALAAAVAWLKKNKVQTLKLGDNSVETSADGGVAKLDAFFTESNSLLAGTIDDRLPIPISAKSEGFTTESYKRFVVTVNGYMTVTLHTPTSGDAEIFECRFNGSSLSADASITFAGATVTTMDANCGTVTAGKVALMSAFWNGTTWDVNWKVEG